MIHDYVIKFIENLPDPIKNVQVPQRMDLVLDGGAFNGSYLIGALYFLKEMEKRNYIKICKKKEKSDCEKKTSSDKDSASKKLTKKVSDKKKEESDTQIPPYMGK